LSYRVPIIGIETRYRCSCQRQERVARNR